jgi:rubrerythrin
MNETIKNLGKAFVGESQARNRYTYYAKVAKKEGYELVSEVFLITAENEKVHAKRIFEHIKELKEGNTDDLEIEAKVPVVYGNTIENLKAAINGEDYEYTSMYPDFAKKAEEEGFGKVAVRLKSIAEAEHHHRDRFKRLLKAIEENTMFKKDKEVEWMCRECGYVHKGKEAPGVCPSCNHPKAYFQLRQEDY